MVYRTKNILKKTFMVYALLILIMLCSCSFQTSMDNSSETSHIFEKSQSKQPDPEFSVIDIASYEQNYGIEVMGIIKNEGKTVARDIRIKISLIKGNDTFQTDFCSAAMDYVPPKLIVPFDCMIGAGKGESIPIWLKQFEKIRVDEISAKSSSKEIYLDFDHNVDFTLANEYGVDEIRLNGEIINTGNYSAFAPETFFIFYDNNKKFIGYGSEKLDCNELKPSYKCKFSYEESQHGTDFELSDIKTTKITTYSLYQQG